MKITKHQLKQIVREELAKQKLLSEDVNPEGWWDWNLNEFEDYAKDTLAFIKSSEGKLKQIASIAIKGLNTLNQPVGGKELDTQAHELVRQNVHKACVKFFGEWTRMNVRFKNKIGGYSWHDAINPFLTPLSHTQEKLYPVEKIPGYPAPYSEFLELIDALHPDFQKSRLTQGRPYSATYIKNIHKTATQGDIRKARDICVGGIMNLIKLPKLVYTDIATDLHGIINGVVADEAWKTEREIFRNAYADSSEEAESKAKEESSLQTKNHYSAYEEMIKTYKNSKKKLGYPPKQLLKKFKTPNGFLPSHRIFAKGVKDTSQYIKSD